MVLFAMRQNGHALKYAHPSLRLDGEVVFTAIRTSGSVVLCYADIRARTVPALNLFVRFVKGLSVKEMLRSMDGTSLDDLAMQVLDIILQEGQDDVRVLAKKLLDAEFHLESGATRKRDRDAFEDDFC